MMPFIRTTCGCTFQLSWLGRRGSWYRAVVTGDGRRYRSRPAPNHTIATMSLPGRRRAVAAGFPRAGRLTRPSFADPPELAQPLAVADPSALSCSVTGPGTIPPPGSVTG